MAASATAPYSRLFQAMFQNPKLMRHCIFVGSPGSGKTTTAQQFCLDWIGPRELWIGRVLFLNASDERSLEVVRSKVYQFVRSTLTSIFQFAPNYKNSKVIVFDEAETLTEQAQLCLRPLLNGPANDICILFLCNSLSRIHVSLLTRFCTLYFYPQHPAQYEQRLQLITKNPAVRIAPMDALYTRSDVRSFLFHPTRGSVITKFLVTILHCPLYEIELHLRRYVSLFFPKLVLSQIVYSFLFLGYITPAEMKEVLFLGDADVLRVLPEETWFQYTRNSLVEWRRKFDSCC